MGAPAPIAVDSIDAAIEEVQPESRMHSWHILRVPNEPPALSWFGDASVIISVCTQSRP